MSKLRRRSNRKHVRTWLKRSGFTIVATCVGIASISDTIANSIAKFDPATAFLLAPWDGKIAASLAQESFALKPSPGEDSEPARLARLALKKDATAVGALNVLGAQAQLRNNPAQARILFAFSLKLSRRELQPRIWAIEEAVSRGDIAEVLRNYDIALKTSTRAPDLLFPVLASALVEPKVRGVLLNQVASKPDWLSDFIDFAAEHSSAPNATSEFFTEGSDYNLPVEESHQIALVNSLAAKNLYEDAWRYFATFRANLDRQRSRDIYFRRAGENAAVFEWRTFIGNGLFASMQPTSEGPVIEFSAAPAVSGVVLQQLQMLPVGSYRLTGITAGINQDSQSRPYWLLACASGKEIGRVIVPNSISAKTDFSGRLAVPENCPVQLLSFKIRSSTKVQGVSGRIYSAELLPDG